MIETKGFSRSCIYIWLARYRQDGCDALKAPQLTARPVMIKAAQVRWLYRAIAGKSLMQFRFKFPLWTREMIGALLWEKYRLRLSLASITPFRGSWVTCELPLWRP